MEKARGPGRPRAFDMDAALDAAIVVFSKAGYHAASISELGAAMGLTAGSIYKAFPDKRAVFVAAFTRYRAVRDRLLADELQKAPDGRDRIRRMVEFYAESAHGAAGRQGCLVNGTASELALFDEDIAGRVRSSLERTRALLTDILLEGQLDGSIGKNLDVPATAMALLFFLQGMRVVGKTAPDREDMFATVAVAMKLLD